MPRAVWQVGALTPRKDFILGCRPKNKEGESLSGISAGLCVVPSILFVA